MKSFIYILAGMYLLQGCLVIKQPQITAKKPISSTSVYRKINMEEMVRRYIAKSHQGDESIEGIYTVSAEVTKLGKGLLSKEERERIVDKKNNYATVAILKDWPGSDTEYIEISLEGTTSSGLSIISEITTLAGNQGFIVEHIDKRGKKMPFTFTSDGPGSEILHGVYSETVSGGVVTYKLSYLKTYPKNKNFAQEN